MYSRRCLHNDRWWEDWGRGDRSVPADLSCRQQRVAAPDTDLDGAKRLSSCIIRRAARAKNVGGCGGGLIFVQRKVEPVIKKCEVAKVISLFFPKVVVAVAHRRD